MNKKIFFMHIAATVFVSMLVLLGTSTSLFAEDGKLATSVSIADNPVSVVFSSSSDELDKAVYNALCVVVVDGDSNKIDFSYDDISLAYTKQIGTQKVTVTFKGNDKYEASAATGYITITDASKKDTRLVLKANPPAVGFSSDQAVLDKAVYDDLCIVVVDSDSNKIPFSQNDITLNYNRVIGIQTVAVTYKGNEKYNNSAASAKVEITGKMDTKISLAASPPSVAFTTDAAKLDLAVYQALNIAVVDAGNNKINFTANDIEISYNREVGKQDVTVKYKGNDQYTGSKATGNVTITGKTDPPIPAKENTSVSLTKSPPGVIYNSNSVKMDADVTAALGIQVVDSKNNKINFSSSDIEISYNRTAGDQPVTVKYKGTDKYNSSQADQTVKIKEQLPCSLVLTANPPTVTYDENKNNLDAAVYENLCIALVDDDNNAIKFEKKDIELTYKAEIGDQQVVVKYKGNDNYKSTIATTRIVIAKSNSQWGTLKIVGVIMAVVIILGIVGFIIYRKKHKTDSKKID
ncbi:hypothetical protein GH810_13650 [Acetobacterium paludosum]|uniref:Bacterial Ig-like domain-containing protein n=1 Tax=Acetobacterium paludosum TaxID=52693 RepID=A0A923KXA7_9FIRM|nr:hypothetical protein [Acetobacterium paludosum]MBC3889355.1 hypothetical protein [Acetobacterium paludosum]